MRGVAVVVAAVAVLLGGCDDEDAPPSVTDVELPESRDEGIQATGTLDGSRIAISRGNPTVVAGDCDADDGLDEDLCILARTIDGLGVNLVIENPAVLVPGETIAAGIECSTDCDSITEGAVVEVRVDGEVLRVEGGTLTVAEAGPPRWTVSFDLALPFGDRLNGTFDVVATPRD